jgi:methylmalonyl-CoA mutase, C-terminal domain
MDSTHVLLGRGVMLSKKNKIRMIIATLGLEPHWRGAVTVARMLQGLGVEVIYIGNAYPGEIIQAAIHEDVDVVGVSTLTGSHLTLGTEILQIAREYSVENRIVFTIGGILPPGDVPKLREIGFDGMFGPGSTAGEIHSLIVNAVTAKANRGKGASFT